MTSSFNVELQHFDDRYIEDIACTLANALKPLRITRSTLADLPYLVAAETDARTAFRLYQLLNRIPGTRILILDATDASKVSIDMETVTLHYRIAFLENGKSIERENDLVSPLIARRELGLKTEQEKPDPVIFPTIDLQPSDKRSGADYSVLEMAELVIQFLEGHDHAWTSGGEFIRSILACQ